MSVQIKERTSVGEGLMGYRYNARSTIELRWGAGEDGPTERIDMVTAEPARLIVHEPTVSATGDVSVHIELGAFELVGTSQVLFPGEKVRLISGSLNDPDLRPSVGLVTIKAGTDLAKDGADSRQFIYLKLVTPKGVMYNELPALMTCRIHAVPPVGETYIQQGIVHFKDPLTNEAAAKTATSTTLVNDF